MKPSPQEEELKENDSSGSGPLMNDAPPMFKTWNQLYAFVLILHAVIIFLFYQLTQAYS